MICSMRGRSDGEWFSSSHEQRLEIGGGISHSLTHVTKDNLLLEPQVLRHVRTEEEKRRRHLYGDSGAKFTSKTYEPATDGVSNTITTVTKDNQVIHNMGKRYRIRKLTPRECFRLMGVRDKDIDKIMSTDESGKRFISDSKCYQLAGNSIVVDTMVDGIFKNLFLGSEKPKDTLF